jgi:hypothetical protein
LRFFITVCIYWLFTSYGLFGNAVAYAQERAVHDQGGPSKRIALLIGNAKYEQSVPDITGLKLKPLRILSNPCNDITQIAAVLEAGGWNPNTEIISICDANRSKLRDAIDQFKDVYFASEPAFGFVYYAGHGLQVDKETFLFGTDSAIDVEKDTAAIIAHDGGNMFRGGVRLFADLISQVGDAGTGSIFIVIDACRETPIDTYVQSRPDLVSAYYAVKHGSYPKPVVGIKLLYSTAYGDLSSDGLGGGSPFALEFEKHLKGSRVENLVSQVVKGVRDTTRLSSIPQIPDATGALNPPPPDDCLTQCGGPP